MTVGCGKTDAVVMYPLKILEFVGRRRGATVYCVLYSCDLHGAEPSVFCYLYSVYWHPRPRIASWGKSFRGGL